MMRDINGTAIEYRTILDQDEQLTPSLTPMGSQANDMALGAEDCSSNVWVEALLHESIGEELHVGNVRLNVARRVVSYNGKNVRFTPLDFALLLILARHGNRTVTIARIYRRLWGPTCKISVPRLRVRVFRVRQKLNEKRIDGIRINNRNGLGYMLEIEPQLRIQSRATHPKVATISGEPSIRLQASAHAAIRNGDRSAATAAE